MDSVERQAAWKDLVAWVTWLHDRYELGMEERLPPCWAEHPGLIEEFYALKAWREEIYESAQPSGQAARYWHAEMRQTIHAALTFYAAGCRAEHQGATDPAQANDRLQRRWAAADHTAGIPSHLLRPSRTSSRPDSDVFLTNATMGQNRLVGRVQPLSQTVHNIVRYDGSWWVSTNGGWLRVTDTDMAAKCNERAEVLARADAAVARRQARETTASYERG